MAESQDQELLVNLVQQAKRAFATDISYIHDFSKQAWQIRSRKESPKKQSKKVVIGEHSSV